ncbi:hypothetical protein ABPG74_019209 [Tetrahymena malaccensis]
MKKLLFLIPVIFLIGASVLLIQGDNTRLSADSNPVTIAQYQECMKNINYQNPCFKSYNYQNALVEFVLYLKNNSDCIAFNEYVDIMSSLKEQDTADLNYNQLYQKCHTNPELISIAKKNYDCLWEKLIREELIQCSGLKL